MSNDNESIESVPVGQLPPLGVVPKLMYAQALKSDRLGVPLEAFQSELLPVPELGPNDVLVAVMAAGVNYNNVWASLGYPLDVIKMRQAMGEEEDFHIGGTDASGIVWKVGEKVTTHKVGDEVIVFGGVFDYDDPWVINGGDPVMAPSSKAWGYETNYGSFAQFCKAAEKQCVPKPAYLSWASSACFLACAVTAHRMLHRWVPNNVKPGDVVLVWGGSGGLGVFGIQLAKLAGAIPVAVVGSEERGNYCLKLGAAGFINRNEFDHWGSLTDDINDLDNFAAWCQKVRKFGKAIWAISGKGKNPQIVIEHPGQSTMPTSMMVCDTGGMVVTCAGSTGYNATVDLRFLWMRQKRLQGSHMADLTEVGEVLEMINRKEIKTTLSHAFKFEETGLVHQLMHDNKHPVGNLAILVGASGLEQSGPVALA